MSGRAVGYGRSNIAENLKAETQAHAQALRSLPVWQYRDKRFFKSFAWPGAASRRPAPTPLNKTARIQVVVKACGPADSHSNSLNLFDSQS